MHKTTVGIAILASIKSPYNPDKVISIREWLEARSSLLQEAPVQSTAGSSSS